MNPIAFFTIEPKRSCDAIIKQHGDITPPVAIVKDAIESIWLSMIVKTAIVSIKP